MKRRSMLAGIPLLLLGGCTTVLTEGEVRFEAEAATVSEDALEQTGYREVGVRDERVEREFEQVDRTVVVVNVIAEYTASVSVGPLEGDLARFTVLSTPKVDVVPGRPTNPVATMDHDDLAETFQEEYDDVGGIRQVGEREATLLDDTVDVSQYAADARTDDGRRMEVDLHVAQGESGDDIVVALGVTPRQIDHRSEIDSLLAGIRHPA